LRRVRNGDEDAFAALAIADHRRLFRVAYGILRDRGLAEDATQAALLEIWRDIGGLREPARFEGWSYRILVHACGREARRVPDWETAEAISGEPVAGDGLAAVEDRDQLERGFRRISVEHRAVIVLRCLLDLPMDEVAEALGVAPGTVGSRLHRALEAMRAALAAEARSTVEIAGVRAVAR
jgi:RNA polymerase sigma-70 factor (ECF subfamily)